MTMKHHPALMSAAGFLVAFLCLIPSSQCLALTAREVTEKMTQAERAGYLSGLIDMRALIAAQSGDAALPRCVHDAYSRNIGSANDAWAQLYDAFAQFPDKEAPMIVFLLIKKTCGG